MKIVHQGSGQEFASRCSGAAAGAARSTTWNIPPAAKLGVYEVSLERDAADAKPRASARARATARRGSDSWSSGNFRVEEFRLPLVDARVSGPKAVQVAAVERRGRRADELPLRRRDGGARRCARRRLLKSAQPGLRRLRRVLVRAAARSEKAEQEEPASDEDERRAARDGKLVADKLPLTTDRNGAATLHAEGPAESRRGRARSTPRSASTTRTARRRPSPTRIDLWPSAVVLGVRAGSWASNRGRAKFTVLALDTVGQADQGPERRGARAASARSSRTRKRMVGGFYAYDNRTEVKELGALCTGTTDDRGLLLCEATLDSRRPGRADRRRRKDGAGHRGRGRGDASGSRSRASSGSRRTTTTASTSCPRRSATSPARPRGCRCACRSARRRRWSRSSAKA